MSMDLHGLVRIVMDLLTRLIQMDLIWSDSISIDFNVFRMDLIDLSVIEWIRMDWNALEWVSIDLKLFEWFWIDLYVFE